MKINKIKKVVIALDYNPTAQKVAEVGYAFAKSMDAEISLLHVITDPIYYSSIEYSPILGYTGLANVGALSIENEDGLKNAAQHFMDKTKKHLKDDNIQTLISKGDFADSILEASKKIHADVIIMGSHSRGWLENMLMGSVTEKVLKHTTIPLLIIPTKKQK